jgi:hypothetical protein
MEWMEWLVNLSARFVTSHLWSGANGAIEMPCSRRLEYLVGQATYEIPTSPGAMVEFVRDVAQNRKLSTNSNQIIE